MKINHIQNKKGKALPMKYSPQLASGVLGVLLALPLVAIFFLAESAADLPFLPGNFMNIIIPLIPGDLITFGINTMVDFILALDLGREDTVAKFFETLMASGIFIGMLGVIGTLASAKQLRQNLPLPAIGVGVGALLAIALVFLSDYELTNDNPFYDGQSFAVRSVWIAGMMLLWGTLWGVLSSRWLSLDQSITVTETQQSAATELENATEPSKTPETTSQPATNTASVQRINRREFMIQVGGTTAAITVIGAGLGTLLDEGEQVIMADQEEFSFANFPNANASVQPAPGTRAEYTPVENHYRIDINSGNPPSIDGEAWRLSLTGLIANEMEFTLDQLQNDFEPMNQYVTISCISNRIAGSLISTTGWTGVSMQTILDLVQPSEDASHIRITSADGFFEYLSLNDIRNDERIMLTYAWNEELLREKHGFPLRIYIPDRYGMKQPKWITEIEFVDRWEPGYWVERGWSREARVRTTSVVDTVAVNDRFEANGQMLIPIGGIAYSGDKGIARVEVQVDGGDWVEAQLRAPLSDTTWVIWRYDWPLEKGEHEFAVRCYSGSGEMQITEVNGTKPNGATGIHSLEASV